MSVSRSAPYYGVFYRRGKRWCGPYFGELFKNNDEKLIDYMKDVRSSVKKEVKLFRIQWRPTK